jgi:hypothetical protein
MTTEIPRDFFAARRIGLEDQYFHQQDVDLMAKLRGIFERKVDREELRTATGIKSEEVLDRLLALHAKGEMLLAFRLYPLVEIAWADGVADARQTNAVIAAAIKLGVPSNSAALHTIEDWIKRGPAEDGRLAWYMYADELRKTLNPAELEEFKNELLAGAKAVANASGGILGIAFQVSHKEQQILDHIARALTHG